MPGEVNRGLPSRGTVLVLGGARSGKSRHAEGLFEGVGDRLYVATGQAFDDEMRVRIAAHQAGRDAAWRTVEAPLDPGGVLADDPAPALVDCLTLWLTNLLLGGHDCEAAVASLEAVLAARAAPTVLVSNEVGLGIVPGDALSRRFRDLAGGVHQRLAARAVSVVFVAAGLPLRLR